MADLGAGSEGIEVQQGADLEGASPGPQNLGPVQPPDDARRLELGAAQNEDTTG